MATQPNENGSKAFCSEILCRTLNDYKSYIKHLDYDGIGRAIYDVKSFADSEECYLYCAIADVDVSHFKRQLNEIDNNMFKGRTPNKCAYCGAKFYRVSTNNGNFCCKKCEKKYITAFNESKKKLISEFHSKKCRRCKIKNCCLHYKKEEDCKEYNEYISKGMSLDLIFSPEMT